MRSRAWIIVVVVIAVAAVLIAKQSLNGPPPIEPVTTAQSPLPEAPAPEPAPSPAPEGEAQTQPPAEADQLEPPAPAPAPEPAPQPARPPEPEKPAKALPGNMLPQCRGSGRPTMAEFGAAWCGACKQMEPVIEEAVKKHGDEINIVYVDVSEYGDTARQFSVRLIPTQIFFDADGTEVGRHVGYWPLSELEVQFAELAAIE